MKKLLSAFLAGCMLFSVVAVSGCGKKDKEADKDKKEKGASVKEKEKAESK